MAKEGPEVALVNSTVAVAFPVINAGQRLYWPPLKPEDLTEHAASVQAASLGYSGGRFTFGRYTCAIR